MNGEPTSEHTDVGAYALGLLEPRDRQAFEEHLAGCPACAAELAELSGMKTLLSDLGPVEAPADEPTEANVTDLVRQQALHPGQFGQFRGARRAPGQVLLERLPVPRFEQPQRVRADVGVLAVHGLAVHAGTPRSARATRSALSA